MNRLWVRISLIIALVVALVVLLPAAVRVFTRPQPGAFRPPAVALDAASEQEMAERFAQAQEQANNRLWQSLLATLGIGSLIGIGFGIWLGRSISRPLTELERGARAGRSQPDLSRARGGHERNAHGRPRLQRHGG